MDLTKAVSIVENFAVARRACTNDAPSNIGEALEKLVSVCKPVHVGTGVGVSINLSSIRDLADQAQTLAKLVADQPVAGLPQLLTELNAVSEEVLRQLVAFQAHLRNVYETKPMSLSMGYRVQGEDNAHS